MSVYQQTQMKILLVTSPQLKCTPCPWEKN